jgi:hypothetical protein
VPGLSPARGVGVEAGRASVRLARLPLEMAMGGVGQLAGRLGRVMPWWSTGRSEPPPADSGIPVLLVHGVADGASVVSPLQRGLRGCGVGPFIPFGYSALGPDIRTAARASRWSWRVPAARAGRPS